MCILKRVLSMDLFIDGHCPSDSQNKDLYHNKQMMKKMKFRNISVDSHLNIP